jgi:predicted TIM-barrel fold metal-dependent hydrolase
MIDIHTHLHPPKLFKAIRRWFAERSTWDLSQQPTDPVDVAAAMRAAGVERFAFCSYAHKPGMARDINAWLAQTSRALGGFGVPLATVHPDDPEYVDDLRLALDDGCIGLKLHEDVQRVASDDDRLAPIYAELEARGAFLLVHVGPIPWAYPAGEGLARIERVVAKYPALGVVVAHFGVPDSLGYFTAMARAPHLHLDTTMIAAPISPMHEPIDPSLIVAHADRVLYGTDFPNVPHPYATELHALEALGLPSNVFRAVVHDNAARLFVRAGVTL